MHATAPRPVVFPVVPVVRYRRPQTLFRGTRVLTGLILAFAGFVMAGFAGLAVPLASLAAAADVTIDRGLLQTLTKLAPYLFVAGALHLVAASGIWRDRAWGYRLGTWMVAIGVFACVAGLVIAFAGRDPFSVFGRAASPSVGGIGILLWTLAWYGVAGWGIQRVVVAREG